MTPSCTQSRWYQYIAFAASSRRAIGVDYYSDSSPFELVFSYKLFRLVPLPVKPGYRVPTMLGDQYGAVREVGFALPTCGHYAVGGRRIARNGTG